MSILSTKSFVLFLSTASEANIKEMATATSSAATVSPGSGLKKRTSASFGSAPLTENFSGLSSGFSVGKKAAGPLVKCISI